jgi:hypothetical protein
MGASTCCKFQGLPRLVHGVLDLCQHISLTTTYEHVAKYECENWSLRLRICEIRVVRRRDGVSNKRKKKHIRGSFMILPLAIKYESGIIWENEMGKVCDTYGKEENYAQSFDEETCSEDNFWNA